MFNNEITLEPSSKKRTIKDMIIDKSDFWEKHSAVKPYVVSNVDPRPTSESKQTPEQFDNFLDSDLCIQLEKKDYKLLLKQLLVFGIV